jgi:hypothetical protein
MRMITAVLSSASLLESSLEAEIKRDMPISSPKVLIWPIRLTATSASVYVPNSSVEKWRVMITVPTNPNATLTILSVPSEIVLATK